MGITLIYSVINLVENMFYLKAILKVVISCFSIK